jgi:hypothetical protein
MRMPTMQLSKVCITNLTILGLELGSLFWGLPDKPKEIGGSRVKEMVAR